MTDEARSLLVVTQFYAPEVVGSAPYLTDVTDWFTERGITVDVLSALPHYPDYRVFPGFDAGSSDPAEDGSLRVHRVPTHATGRSGFAARVMLESRLLASMTWRLITRRVARRSRVVSLCPSVLMVLVGSLACRTGGRHVALVHDIQSGLAAGLGMVGSRWLALGMRLAERTVFNRVDRIVVLSSEMKRRLAEMGVRRPIDVLPIWVDLREIFPVTRPEGSRPLLLYSGNLGRKQGLEQILAMAGLLRDRRPEVQILIRGQGSQGRALRDRAAELELRNVAFKPLVPREELNRSLAEADIHLVPQAPRGAEFAVPSKVYTIMAAGRPLICTAFPDSPLGSLAERTGALACVPPGDPEALAAAALELLDDPRRREKMGREGRRYVASHASRDLVLSRLETLCGLRPAGDHQSRSLS